MSRVNDEIDRIAAEWAAKAFGEGLAPGEQADFISWHAADVRHRGAYARAELTLLRLDRLRAIGSDVLRARIAESKLVADDQCAKVVRGALSEVRPPAIFARNLTRRRLLLRV